MRLQRPQGAPRGAANPLGGRAGRYELRGLTAGELGTAFDLNRMLNHGYLPRIYQAARPRRLLDAYVADYLPEEVAAEGLVRNLPAFSGFLDDTLLGRWLNAYRRRRKRRVIGAPKFYFADVGVVNGLSRRGELSAGSQLYGKAFENWVFHELSACIEYQEWDLELTYWRLPSGIEVNFVLGDMGVVVEAKARGPHHPRPSARAAYPGRGASPASAGASSSVLSRAPAAPTTAST